VEGKEQEEQSAVAVALSTLQVIGVAVANQIWLAKSAALLGRGRN
jgi:hypothetical protein